IDYRGEIRIWDTTTGAERASIRLPADMTHLPPCLSPDGQRLAAVAGPTICLFDVPSGDAGPQIAVKRPTVVRFTPDGSRLVFHEHKSDQLVFWDLASRRRVATVSGIVPPFACSPDGRWLAAIDAKEPLGENRVVRIFNLETLEQFRDLPAGPEPICRSQP